MSIAKYEAIALMFTRLLHTNNWSVPFVQRRFSEPRYTFFVWFFRPFWQNEWFQLSVECCQGYRTEFDCFHQFENDSVLWKSLNLFSCPFIVQFNSRNSMAEQGIQSYINIGTFGQIPEVVNNAFVLGELFFANPEIENWFWAQISKKTESNE